MKTISITLDDEMIDKAQEKALSVGKTLDGVVAEALDKHLKPPVRKQSHEAVEVMERLFERAERENWRSTGPWFTDEEMYNR
ncbi:MAG TPA: hypothetical protein VGB55_02780 [Tepidisphaeraceae bacterium]|jgi:hypothetical protein